ncbi:MAG TPA: ROK family protein [Chthoniobacteraceae bacterium]|nr:ROK family protein [Chthoniobacteraceae bacterium]
MNVLVIDIGGTSVKMHATGRKQEHRFASGPTLTPGQFVDGVKKHTTDWTYNAISIGYPGVVSNNRITVEPNNLGPGWVGFDFKAAFRCPVKIINDAAMQAMGSYRKGTMLFLGLGTGLGTALVADGHVVPLELGAMTYLDGTYEDYIGHRGLVKFGKRKWRAHVARVVKELAAAVCADDITLGGGNVATLPKLPPLSRAGSNSHAFTGGFRLWETGKSK